MFRRSGASQEEPEAGGEYKATSALLCAHVGSPKNFPFNPVAAIFLSRILHFDRFSPLLCAFSGFCILPVLSPHSRRAAIPLAIKHSNAP